MKQISEIMDSKVIVTPNAVKGQINYMKLVEKFGTDLIDDKLIDKFRKVTGKEPHVWIKRGIFFSHRGLHDFLDSYEAGEPVFIYTGRGPSGDMHIGHMIPFMFTKYLQDVFDCPVVIQIADDEKCYFKNLKFNEVFKMGYENTKDIVAFGFNPEKTFIFSNRNYRLTVPQYEEFASTVSQFISVKTIEKIFGFGENTNLGMHMWPIYQSIAAFSKSYPHIFKGRQAHCLAVYAIDQDPYFRLARDIASKMKLLKPCGIMSVSPSGKMSSSDGSDITIFLTDTPEMIKRKINKYAFSGGGGNGTINDHKKYGGNLDVDMSCQYLKYFEMDDDKLLDIHNRFKSGELMCGDTKKILINTLTPYIVNHQNVRKNLTDFDILHFYEKHDTVIPIPKKIELTENEKNIREFLELYGIKYEIIGNKEYDSENFNLCKCTLLRGGGKYFLHVTNEYSTIELKLLSRQLKIKEIDYVENNHSKQLGVTNDNMSIFSLLYISEKYVEVVVDSELHKNTEMQIKFSDNITIKISYFDMLKFFEVIPNIKIEFI